MSAIVEEARLFLGVPYRHLGHTRSAVDCIGLVYAVAKKLGLTDLPLPSYSAEPSGNYLRDKLDGWPGIKKIPETELLPGDIILFRFAKYSQHVAIYTGRNIIHSYYQAGGCVEHIFDAKWKRRMVSAYRFINV